MTDFEIRHSSLITIRTSIRRGLANYYHEQKLLADLADVESRIATLEAMGPAEIAAMNAASAIAPPAPTEMQSVVGQPKPKMRTR